MGLAYKIMGNNENAEQSLRLASSGSQIPERVLYYNDQDDFFAVSQPELEVYQEDMQLRNIIYCNYLRALGYIGLGEKTKASTLLHEILEKQAVISSWKPPPDSFITTESCQQITS